MEKLFQAEPLDALARRTLIGIWKELYEEEWPGTYVALKVLADEIREMRGATMRTRDEIQSAHDSLESLAECPPLSRHPAFPLLSASLDMLCWVLGHNSSFELNLKNLLADLQKRVDRGEYAKQEETIQ